MDEGLHAVRYTRVLHGQHAVTLAVPLQEKNRFTSDGVLVMQSQRHRTQA